MLFSFFGLMLVSAALARLVVLYPLPLAAGLTAGHAALVAGAGPGETFGAFVIVSAGTHTAFGLFSETRWFAVRRSAKAIQIAASLAVALGLIDIVRQLVG